MIIQCPACDAKLRNSSGDNSSRTIQCPKCKHRFLLPTTEEPRAEIIDKPTKSIAPKQTQDAPPKKSLSIKKKSSSGKLPTILAGLVALVAIGVVAWMYISRQNMTPERQPKSNQPVVQAKPTPRPRNDRPRMPPVRRPPKTQELNVFLPIDEVKAAPVVFLEKDAPPRKETDLFMLSGNLERELMRQTFAHFCREEYGAIVRDEILGEQPPRNQPTVAFQILVRGDGRRANGRNLVVAVGPKKQVVWKGPLAYTWNGPCEKMLEEALSKWKKELAPILERYVVKGKVQPLQKAVDKLPKQIETKLRSMSFVPQFSAIRAIHEMIRKQGASPALYGGLARGYTNLGVLTECHWNAAHEIFKARGLIYGRRLVDIQSTPESHWHYAYAQALSGLHKQALDSLAKAEKVQPQAGKPGWASLIEPFCRFDLQTLKEKAKEETHGILAELLCCFMVDEVTARIQPIEASKKFLQRFPQCYRIHDMACTKGGVSHQHVVTVEALQAFSLWFSQQLQAIASLPDGVKKRLANRDSEPSIVQELIHTGQDDSADLSWTVLGQLARETRFLQVFRRLYFMKKMWSVPVGDFLQQALPLVQGHPYKAYLESFGLNPQQAEQAILSIEPRDYDFWQGLLYLDIMKRNPRALLGMQFDRTVRLDQVYRDQALNFDSFVKAPNKQDFFKRLEPISPESPLLKCMKILMDNKLPQKQLDEIEERYAQFAYVLTTLGAKYLREAKYENAESVFKKKVKLIPSKQSYDHLAICYRRQGKMDKWRETLEAYLKTGPEDLAHASVRVKIAAHLMNGGKYQEALPYSEKAAESWAGWAMLQASQCNEALENWERAELWIRRCSERYQSQSRDWYFWCARTGKGDLTAARDYALGKRPDGNHLKPDSNAWMDVLLASDDLKRTRELFEIITRTKQSNYSPILLLVLTYDELGEKNLRNEYLKKVPSNDPTAYAMLGNIFRQTLTKGEDAMIEFADIQKALNLARAIPGAEANVRYFLGRFLIHRGHVKKGSEYLRELVESPLTGSRTRAWAAVALRRANKR